MARVLQRLVLQHLEKKKSDEEGIPLILARFCLHNFRGEGKGAMGFRGGSFHDQGKGTPHLCLHKFRGEGNGALEFRGGSLGTKYFLSPQLLAVQALWMPRKDFSEFSIFFSGAYSITA